MRLISWWCRFSWHLWAHWSEPEDGTQGTEEIDMQRRKCLGCGRVQTRRCDNA